MPQYRRARIKGSVFFFTVVLAERPSNLLFDEIERLRQSYLPFNNAAHLKPSRSASCPIIFTPFGRCRRVMPISLPVGV
jgi:hypothetical protein